MQLIQKELILVFVSVGMQHGHGQCTIGVYAGQNCEVPAGTQPCAPTPKILDLSSCDAFIVGKGAAFEVVKMIPPRKLLVISEEASLVIMSSLTHAGDLIAKNSSKVSFNENLTLTGDRFVVDVGAVVEVDRTLKVDVSDVLIEGSVRCQTGNVYAAKDFIVASNGLFSFDFYVDDDIHVWHGGYFYRTLAGFSKSALYSRSHNDWSSLPAGYEIAPFSSDTLKNVVRPYAWSTDYMSFVEDDGIYGTKFKPHSSSSSSSGHISTNGDSYRSTSSNVAVMIRVQLEASFRACGTLLVNGQVLSRSIGIKMYSNELGGNGTLRAPQVELHYQELLPQTPTALAASDIDPRQDFHEMNSCVVTEASTQSPGIRSFNDSVKELCRPFCEDLREELDVQVLKGFEDKAACDNQLKQMREVSASFDSEMRHLRDEASQMKKLLDTAEARQKSTEMQLEEALTKANSVEMEMREASISKSICQEGLKSCRSGASVQSCDSAQPSLEELQFELKQMQLRANASALEYAKLAKSNSELKVDLAKSMNMQACPPLPQASERTRGFEQVCDLGICGIIGSGSIIMAILVLCIISAILFSLYIPQLLFCHKLQRDLSSAQSEHENNTRELAVKEARVQWLEDETRETKRKLEDAIEQLQTERKRSSIAETQLQASKARLDEYQTLYDVAQGELRTWHGGESHRSKEMQRSSARSEAGNSERSFGAATDASWIPVSKVPAADDDSKPKCFLPDTAFKTTTGHLALVQNLEEGVRVLLDDGREALVASIKRYPFKKKEPYNLCNLVTAQGHFVVSSSHVVATKNGKQQAGHLKIGDEVIVGSRHQPLLNVTHKKARTDLFMVSFDPPGCVEAFPVPSHGLQTFGEPPVGNVDNFVPSTGENVDVESLQPLQLIGCASVTDLEAAMPTEYTD